ncbi:MAG: hypothetical protein J6Y76_03820 [Paludibacteraceae bacterium]|nr:hypothetical protein [Paludibacteraceae bacterium]
MKSDITYDEAVARIEAITKELASVTALGMEAYEQKAAEAQELLAFCRSQLTGLEADLDKVLKE